MKWYNTLMAVAITCCIGCSGNDAPDDNGGNSGNNNNNNNETPTTPPAVDPATVTKCVGADLSQWLGYYNDGAEWYANGTTIDNVPLFFAENGYKVARLRLFVNPDLNSTACQDLNYVIESAQAMRDAGMDICLDFHYSDTWADPGKQYKPAAWKSLSATALQEKIYTYSKEVLEALKAQGITPTHIQIGNEITAGMLWDTGRIGVWGDSYDTTLQWNNFLSLLGSASLACREVCPDAKIIIHIDRGGDAATAQKYYERISNIDYDIIGLSYYPYWHGTLSSLGTTLRTLTTKFPSKEIMIMETGIGYNEWSDDSASAQYGNYPSTPEGQTAFMNDLVETLKQCDHVTGVFYWFPEETKIDWRSSHRIDLNRGLFDKETGEVLPAFYCLPKFLK